MELNETKQTTPFTQLARYRDMSDWEVYNMTDDEAHEVLCQGRWGGSDWVQCPSCNLFENHYKRPGRRQWRCKACQRCFSVTSDTPFAYRKLPLRRLVSVFYKFSAGQKGVSANSGASELGTTVTTAFHNFSKLREVMMQAQDKTPLEGVVQVDGGFFCGKPRKPNRQTKASSTRVNSTLLGRKQSIIPRPFASLEPWNQAKRLNQRVVIVLRQLHPPGSDEKGAVRSITEVVRYENAESVVPILRKHIVAGSTVQTDGGTAYAKMDHAKYTHQPVVHKNEYSTIDGWNNNQAESYISRLRRAEFGTYHGMRKNYLSMYASEMAWREDTRRFSRSERFRDLIKKAMQSGKSTAFFRYKQGHRLKREHMFEATGANKV
jgi:transposase-like protein